MKNPLQKRIARYEKVLANPVWKETMLLKMFSDRLQAMLNQLKAAGLRSGDYAEHVTVFVLMYHQDGRDLTIWEDMIKKIQYAVGRRPVFLTLQEAKAAMRDRGCEAVIVMDVPKQAVLSLDGLRYLRLEDVDQDAVKGFYWNEKIFYLNGLSLVEMNSELTD